MKSAFVFPGQGSQSVGMLPIWPLNTLLLKKLSQKHQTL